MNLFAINLFLAFVWMVLTDTGSASALMSGFVIGFGALWLAQPLYGETGMYFVRTFRIAQLMVFFTLDLIKSSVGVAKAVLTPHRINQSGFLDMPLDVKSDVEILLVANLISLTPGTLSLDVSEDRKTLHIHAMFAADPEAEVKDLKNGMEHMVRRIFSDDA